MIDPQNITNFKRTDEELEEFALFSIAVAGKNATTTARSLDKFLQFLRVVHGNKLGRPVSPCEAINLTPGPTIRHWLRDFGIGCYTMKARSMKMLSGWVCNCKINLRSCSPAELEQIEGIGRKTSRFFLLHSMYSFSGAALDTHILKFLHDKGVANVPTSTPSSAKQYKRLEDAFCQMIPVGMTAAEFDLNIWRQYSNVKHPAKRNKRP